MIWGKHLHSMENRSRLTKYGTNACIVKQPQHTHARISLIVHIFRNSKTKTSDRNAKHDSPSWRQDMSTCWIFLNINCVWHNTRHNDSTHRHSTHKYVISRCVFYLQSPDFEVFAVRVASSPQISSFWFDTVVIAHSGFTWNKHINIMLAMLFSECP